MLIELAPSDIRFMQDSIYPSFYGGKRVNDVIEDIYSGRTSLNVLPRIEVTKRNNKYYSLDNRRLYLYRVLEKRGFLSRVKVSLVSKWPEWKFTTENDGASVIVRGQKTLPHHISDEEELSENLPEFCR